MMDNRLQLSKDFLRNDGNIFVSIDENEKFDLSFILKNHFGFFKEIIWESGAPLRFKATKSIWPRIHETIFHYKKTKDNLYFPTYTLKKTSLGDKILTGSLIKIEDSKIYSMDFVTGARESTGFGTGQKPEKLMKLLFDASVNYNKKSNIIMDFFMGSGTTISSAHKLGLKWIGIEQGDYFNNTFKKIHNYTKQEINGIGCLGRMKKVLSAKDKSSLAREINWKGGGFFKYYDLEQYEQTLKKTKYKDSHPFDNLDDKSIFKQYVFFKDKKLLDAISLNYDKNKVDVDFSKLYNNVDIPETLSCVTGENIKKIGKDFVELENSGKIKFNEIPFKLIKSLVVW